MSLSKRDAIKAQRTKRKRRQRVTTLIVVVAVIIIVILAFAWPTIYNSVKPAGSFISITPIAYPMENGKSVGNPDARVKILIYEDFQCPYCKLFTENDEKQLLQSNYITSGEVYYEFMQFAILDTYSTTKESQQSANASMCALEQGQFWPYHDLLYANQGTVENGGAFTNKRLQAFAESLGLNMTDFNQCFSADKYSAEIQADYQMGIAAGVNSTPTIILNGKILGPGYIPYDQLSAAIDAALAGGG
jgi:protein-disulfide isomerase